MPREGAAHLLLIAETAAPRDRTDSVVGLLKSAPSRADTDALDRAGRAPFARFSVAAGEIAGTHACALCEPFHAKVRGQVLGNDRDAKNQVLVNGAVVQVDGESHLAGLKSTI